MSLKAKHKPVLQFCILAQDVNKVPTILEKTNNL